MTALLRGVVDGLPAMKELGTILGVWAHPDDEGYLSGGIMADAVRNGQPRRVRHRDAWRGRRSRSAGRRRSWRRSARPRSRRRLAILGVTEHRWLDYADGGCAAVDAEDAVGAHRRDHRGSAARHRADVRAGR